MTLLGVDVEPSLAKVLQEALRPRPLILGSFDSSATWASAARASACLIQIERGDETEKLDKIRQHLPTARLVVVSRSLPAEAGFELARRGAAEVISLPVPTESLIKRIDALPRVELPESCGMEAVLRAADRAAAVSSTVLLQGETGSGKGMIAERIHALGDRRDQPFVHVDCAALAPTLIESELFGHERGAFTGAEQRRTGRFELAGRGTLFLDEVGDLDFPLQAKLLRVLESRTYERVGGIQTLRMRARVIAATCVDLERAVEEGRFRRDLFYRLEVLRIVIPPLRERASDLAALIETGLERVCSELGMAPRAFTERFVGRLAAHEWPGNVRELMNVLERVVVSTQAARLDDLHLDGFLAPPETRNLGNPDDPEDVRRVLRECGGNIARAGRRLGLAESTLRYRIKRDPTLARLIPKD